MANFWMSIQSVLSIVIMIAVGYFSQGKGWFDGKFSAALSKIIMNVALPASIFMAMLEKFKLNQLESLSTGLFYTILAIFIGYLLAWGETRLFKVPKGRRGLMMTAINCANTIFIGMPLNISLFGSISVPYLLVYYIVNTIIVWTVGIWVIASDDPTTSDKKVKFDWRHLLPAPLWGFIVVLPFVFFWPSAATQLPSFITTTLNDLGGLVTPLSLIYTGIMLRSFGLKNMDFDSSVMITLFGRFVVSPIIMGLLIFAGLHLGVPMVPMFQKTLIIQAATPTIAVLPILAHTYHGDVKFATNIVASTSVLFIVVVPIIMMLVNFI